MNFSRKHDRLRHEVAQRGVRGRMGVHGISRILLHGGNIEKTYMYITEGAGRTADDRSSVDWIGHPLAYWLCNLERLGFLHNLHV